MPAPRLRRPRRRGNSVVGDEVGGASTDASSGSEAIGRSLRAKQVEEESMPDTRMGPDSMPGSDSLAARLSYLGGTGQASGICGRGAHGLGQEQLAVGTAHTPSAARRGFAGRRRRRRGCRRPRRPHKFDAQGGPGAGTSPRMQCARSSAASFDHRHARIRARPVGS